MACCSTRTLAQSVLHKLIHLQVIRFLQDMEKRAATHESVCVTCSFI